MSSRSPRQQLPLETKTFTLIYLLTDAQGCLCSAKPTLVPDRLINGARGAGTLRPCRGAGSAAMRAPCCHPGMSPQPRQPVLLPAPLRCHRTSSATAFISSLQPPNAPREDPSVLVKTTASRWFKLLGFCFRYFCPCTRSPAPPVS